MWVLVSHIFVVYRRIRVQDVVRNSSRALVSKDILAERLPILLLYSTARSTAILAPDTYAFVHQDDFKDRPTDQ